MSESQVIYAGICGSVTALDAATGRQLWVAELKGVDYVNVVVEGGKIFAATKGEVFCLNRNTGQTLWHNPLKGLGQGLVSLATESGQSSHESVLAEEHRRREAQSAAAASAATAG